MKRSDIPTFLQKMKDMFSQQLDQIPAHALKKKTRGDMEAGFADGARMTLLQLAEEGHITKDGDPTKYTILLIALSDDGTFTLSREADTKDLATLYAYMKAEAQVTDEEMDTLLLFENGKDSPEVVGFWRAANGDFSDL